MIEVRCYDDGHPSLYKDQVFNISVVDRNEAPTAVNMSGGTVEENKPAGQLVASFSTSDPDNEVTVTQVC